MLSRDIKLVSVEQVHQRVSCEDLRVSMTGYCTIKNLPVIPDAAAVGGNCGVVCCGAMITL